MSHHIIRKMIYFAVLFSLSGYFMLEAKAEFETMTDEAILSDVEAAGLLNPSRHWSVLDETSLSEEEKALVKEWTSIGKKSEEEDELVGDVPALPIPKSENGRSVPPQAHAGGSYSSALDTPIIFHGEDSTDDLGIVSYQWNFGDGTTGTGSNPVKVYTSAPTFLFGYAQSAVASSEQYQGNALQAIGNPGDGSWQPDKLATSEQWLEVTYLHPIEIDTLLVHGDMTSGFIVRVDAFDRAGKAITIWQNGESLATNEYHIMKTIRHIESDRIRLYCDNRISGAIDAVRIATKQKEQVVYNVELTVTDGEGQTDTDSTFVVLKTEPLAICVPWRVQESGPSAYHQIWFQNVTNGTQTNTVRLKGVAKGINTPLTYSWDFGDGTTFGPFTVSNKYTIEATHQYINVDDGQLLTATLTITDALMNTSTDTYDMIVRAKTLDVETNIAIDEGLWYLHKSQTRTGVDNGYWYNASYGAYASPTASACQAFMIHGHFEHGSMMDDPYTETVMRGLRHLFARVSAASIGTQPAGNPDTNGNGLGIQVNDGVYPPYQGGAVMDAICATGTPDAIVQTGGSGVIGRTYRDIVVDMSDMYAWGQYDYAPNNGGWRYAWNTGPDNSACQWGAIGMLAGEDYFSLTVPAFVKTENIVWLNYSYMDYGTYGGFSYAGGDGINYARTASGLVQMAFDDLTTAHPKWIGSENYFAYNWASFTSAFDGYACYALAKAMRVAQPSPVVTFTATGKDWYNDPVDGLKRKIVNWQSADGWWDYSWVNVQMTTAWMVITLTESLFTPPPVAVISANGGPVNELWWAPDMELCFNGSESYHLNPEMNIASYDWDMDNDGQFDDCSGLNCCYTWDEFGDFTIALRVIDDDVPPQTATATCTVHMVPPPHAPVAMIDGPYVISAKSPLLIDGSSSFDIDPGDYVTEYWWDLDGQPWNFDTVRGGPEVAQISHTFTTPGYYRIGLKVWDDGVFNDGIKWDDNAYTTVEVLAAVPAMGHIGIIALLMTFGAIIHYRRQRTR